MVPSRPFPVLHIHGTADAWVPYVGGISPVDGWQWLACEDVVRAYAAINGCDSTPSLTDLPDLDPTDDTTVQLLTYNNCGTYVDSEGKTRPAEALLYRVVGGGHNWPGDYNWVRKGEVPVTHDIVASEVIWAFFKRHVLAAAPVP